MPGELDMTIAGGQNHQIQINELNRVYSVRQTSQDKARRGVDNQEIYQRPSKRNKNTCLTYITFNMRHPDSSYELRSMLCIKRTQWLRITGIEKNRRIDKIAWLYSIMVYG